jgi:hypothetical protein
MFSDFEWFMQPCKTYSNLLRCSWTQLVRKFSGTEIYAVQQPTMRQLLGWLYTAFGETLQWNTVTFRNEVMKQGTE